MQTKTKYSDIPCEDAIAAMQRKAVSDNDSKVNRLIEALHSLTAEVKMLRDENEKLRDNQRAWS